MKVDLLSFVSVRRIQTIFVQRVQTTTLIYRRYLFSAIKLPSQHVKTPIDYKLTTMMSLINYQLKFNYSLRQVSWYCLKKFTYFLLNKCSLKKFIVLMLTFFCFSLTQVKIETFFSLLCSFWLLVFFICNLPI